MTRRYRILIDNVAASWVAITTVVPVRLMRSSNFMIPTLV